MSRADKILIGLIVFASAVLVSIFVYTLYHQWGMQQESVPMQKHEEGQDRARAQNSSNKSMQEPKEGSGIVEGSTPMAKCPFEEGCEPDVLPYDSVETILVSLSEDRIVYRGHNKEAYEEVDESVELMVADVVNDAVYDAKREDFHAGDAIILTKDKESGKVTVITRVLKVASN